MLSLTQSTLIRNSWFVKPQLISSPSYFSRLDRHFCLGTSLWKDMKIAIIGQSQFGSEVYKLLKKNGHDIVGVFTIPDVNGKPDPLAISAAEDNVPVFKISKWRLKSGKSIPEVVEKYYSVKPDLNVMPFCSQFIPMDVIDHPTKGSIIYHPSILPKHRGASAINWTLMEGDDLGGFTIFWADDGLDTGPILLQRKVEVDPNDTVDTIYNRFLYPEGIKAMAEAVDMVEKGEAPHIIQPTEGATYDKMIKKNVVEIDWKKTGSEIHNWIRGNDKVPGAWTTIAGEKVTLFSSSVYKGGIPKGDLVTVEGMSRDAVVHQGGMMFFGSDKRGVNVKNIQFEDGRMITANKFGKGDANQDLELTGDEQVLQSTAKTVWASILGFDASKILPETDFFKSGAASMDVARLVEEIKQKCSLVVANDDVYMCTTFKDFVQLLARKNRGIEDTVPFTYDAVELRANDLDLKFPNQVFFNNQFLDSSSGKTFDTINPTTEEVICNIASGTAEDVDAAVQAAKVAFEEGEWSKMNARDRGNLIYKLADVMEEHKEELATLETLDSGAVYTLALKTHIGMSIDTFRYFAGWCDKIHGQVIPINNSRPNHNLTFTRREPFGVCGLVVPWNYPLMMLAWKMAACIAAGNTVVLKPANVTPLTALKFAELTVKAGFPPG